MSCFGATFPQRCQTAASFFKMVDFAEQHAALKFCFLLGKNASEAVDLLSVAYKEHSLSKTQVYEWFSRFKKGDLSLERRPGSGRPATARTDKNIEKIRVLVE